APFACTANTVHDFTDLPSRSTVQAPQWLVSQPICGPVSCSCSRKKWMSSVRGSTSSSTFLPFTVMEMWDFAIVSLPKSGAGALFGAGKCAREHYACHLRSIGRRSASIGRGRGDCFRSGDRFFHSCRVQCRTDENFPRLLGP